MRLPRGTHGRRPVGHSGCRTATQRPPAAAVRSGLIWRASAPAQTLRSHTYGGTAQAPLAGALAGGGCGLAEVFAPRGPARRQRHPAGLPRDAAPWRAPAQVAPVGPGRAQNVADLARQVSAGQIGPAKMRTNRTNRLSSSIKDAAQYPKCPRERHTVSGGPAMGWEALAGGSASMIDTTTIRSTHYAYGHRRDNVSKGI